MRILSILLTLFSLLGASSKYELGSGYPLLSSYLYIGGYVSLSYTYGEKINGTSIDDFGILSYGQANSLTYLGELESINPYQYSFISKKTLTHTDIYIKRIFAKYDFNENIALKLGKFYTPIGLWNDIPINVLRDTTSTPLTVTTIYPMLATGLDTIVQEQFEDGLLTCNALIQTTQDIHPQYNSSIVDTHYALSISYETQNFLYKLSGGYFHEQTSLRVYHDDGDNDEDDYFNNYEISIIGNNYNYLLLGFKYEDDMFTLQSEIARQYHNSEVNIDYMGYIQATYRDNKHSYTLRFEDYKDRENERHHDTFSVIAYTYRPLYPIAFKTEYQLHSIKQNNIAIFSFSILL